jgi:hypothetical protein
MTRFVTDADWINVFARLIQSAERDYSERRDSEPKEVRVSVPLHVAHAMLQIVQRAKPTGGGQIKSETDKLVESVIYDSARVRLAKLKKNMPAEAAIRKIRDDIRPALDAITKKYRSKSLSDKTIEDRLRRRKRR